MGGYLARQRRTHLFLQMGFVILLLLGLYFLLKGLSEVVIPLLISFLLAYLLDPIIDWFERRGVNRTVGVLILLAGVAVFVTAFIMFMIPLVGHEVAVFAKRIPMYIARIQDDAIPWIERTFSIRVPQSLTEFADTFGYGVKDLTQQVVGSLSEFAGTAMTGAYKVLALLGILILIPFFTFFLLRDFDKMAQVIYGLIPNRYHVWAEDTWLRIDKVLSGWIRGQFLVMFVLGTLYSIGYVLVGIPLGLIIGMLTGIMAFVPYLGAAIGFLLALSMAFLDWQGWGQIFWVTFVFGSVQTLDAFFITPNILGHGAGVSPAVVVLSFLVFGKLFGFVGILLAVPAVGVIKVLIDRALISYRKSAFFTADNPGFQRVTTLSGVPPPAAAPSPIKTADKELEGDF